MRWPTLFAATALVVITTGGHAQTPCTFAESLDIAIGQAREGALNEHSCKGLNSGRTQLYMQPYRITLTDTSAVEIRVESDKLMSGRLVGMDGEQLAQITAHGPYTKPGVWNRFILPPGTFYLLLSSYLFSEPEQLKYRVALLSDTNSATAPVRLISCTPAVAVSIGATEDASQIQIDAYDRGSFPKPGTGCDFDDRTEAMQTRMARSHAGISFYKVTVPSEQFVGVAVNGGIANLWMLDFKQAGAAFPDAFRGAFKPLLLGTAYDLAAFQIKLPRGNYFVVVRGPSPCDGEPYCFAGKPYALKVSQYGTSLPWIGNPPAMPTVVLDGKEWMSTNLAVDRLRNGDAIPHVNVLSDFHRLGEEERKPASVCHGPCSRFGMMYNHYAVRQGLAPFGWRVPTASDIQSLIQYLGGPTAAQSKLRASSSWTVPGTNSSGFNALPGGYSLGFPESGTQHVNYWAWEDKLGLSVSARAAELTTVQGFGDRIGKYVRLIRAPRERLPVSWITLPPPLEVIPPVVTPIQVQPQPTPPAVTAPAIPTPAPATTQPIVVAPVTETSARNHGCRKVRSIEVGRGIRDMISPYSCMDGRFNAYELQLDGEENIEVVLVSGAPGFMAMLELELGQGGYVASGFPGKGPDRLKTVMRAKVGPGKVYIHVHGDGKPSPAYSIIVTIY